MNCIINENYAGSIVGLFFNLTMINENRLASDSSDSVIGSRFWPAVKRDPSGYRNIIFSGFPFWGNRGALTFLRELRARATFSNRSVLLCSVIVHPLAFI